MSQNLLFDQVAVGQLMPELSIDITSRLIVGAAIATRDYQDVHHDQDRARELGSPDIFMNILTTNGFVGRYVTDWTGPRSVLKKVSIRLGAPNYPGAVMTISGEVTAKNQDDDTVVLKVVGKNSLGNHVQGSVTVALPKE